MSICEKCVKRDVCCDEGKDEEALTYCASYLEERPHGEWIALDVYEAYHQCSNCGILIDNDFPIWRNFCPNCGARMGDAK